MRLNETCNMIIEQEYIENVVFSQPDGLPLNAGGEIMADCLVKVLKMKRRKRSKSYSAPLAF